MPYFNFDLIIGEKADRQGGMILENTEGAIDKADSLANELCIVRPELRSRGCAVRVSDTDSKELYRTPLDPTAIRPDGRPPADDSSLICRLPNLAFQNFARLASGNGKPQRESGNGLGSTWPASFGAPAKSG